MSRLVPREKRPDAYVEVAMTAPVFVVYQLGLLVLDVQNGADWITGLLLRLLDSSRLGYALFVLTIGAAMVAVARRAHRDPEAAFGRVLGEGALFAVGLYLSVGLVGDLLVPDALSFGRDSLVGAIVLSAGAGFHEELLFRIAGFEGGRRLLSALSVPSARAMAIAALGSSLLFAMAHHVGPLGEPLRAVPFAMRFVSGLYLCAVVRYRGFATAVYAHTLYDIVVMVFRP